MSGRTLRRKLAGLVGGIAVLGTVGCLLTTTAAAALAVVGGGAGYAVGGEALALVLVKTAILGGLLVRRYR